MIELQSDFTTGQERAFELQPGVSAGFEAPWPEAAASAIVKKEAKEALVASLQGWGGLFLP